MADSFRKSRIVKYIKQLEARADVHKNAPHGTQGHEKHQVLLEVAAELKQMFELKEEQGK